jgi:hypothetical protein
MLKINRPSFVILWVVVSYVKLTCTTCTAMKINTIIVISHNFEILVICAIWWVNLIVGVQQVAFSYYGKLYITQKTCKLTWYL